MRFWLLSLYKKYDRNAADHDCNQAGGLKLLCVWWMDGVKQRCYTCLTAQESYRYLDNGEFYWYYNSITDFFCQIKQESESFDSESLSRMNL